MILWCISTSGLAVWPPKIPDLMSEPPRPPLRLSYVSDQNLIWTWVWSKKLTAVIKSLQWCVRLAEPRQIDFHWADFLFEHLVMIFCPSNYKANIRSSCHPGGNYRRGPALDLITRPSAELFLLVIGKGHLSAQLPLAPTTTACRFHSLQENKSEPSSSIDVKPSSKHHSGEDLNTGGATDDLLVLTLSKRMVHGGIPIKTPSTPVKILISVSTYF